MTDLLNSFQAKWPTSFSFIQNLYFTQAAQYEISELNNLGHSFS